MLRTCCSTDLYTRIEVLSQSRGCRPLCNRSPHPWLSYVCASEAASRQAAFHLPLSPKRLASRVSAILCCLSPSVTSVFAGSRLLVRSARNARLRHPVLPPLCCLEPSSPLDRQFGGGSHSNRPSTYASVGSPPSLRGPLHWCLAPLHSRPSPFWSVVA